MISLIQFKTSARLAVLGVAGIVLMAVLGILYAAGVAPEGFNLDAEWTVPSIYSGLLLVVAAAEALEFALRVDGVDRTLVMLIAYALVFLALDELFSVHERIDFHTDVDWQVTYAPFAAAFAWAMWRITGFLGRRGPEAKMIFAGLGAWAVAQLLEAAAHGEVFPSLIDDEAPPVAQLDDAGHSRAYLTMSIAEELLEMGGSLLLAVALAYAVVRRPLRL